MTFKTGEPEWLTHSKRSSRDLHVELDTLLRGIDRFFNIENLPLEKDTVGDRSFFQELSIVRDAMGRAISILDGILPDELKNNYRFRKFAESKLSSDRIRDRFKRDLLAADDPEKCILSLYDTLTSFRGVTGEILKARHITYISYRNLGDLICKEIRDNRYMSPFRFEVNPEYDLIESSHLSAVVKSIGDRKLKRSISMSFLYLFRLLRYLGCIDTYGKKNIPPGCGLLILSLVNSELRYCVDFFRKEVTGDHLNQFRSLFESIIFQLEMELKRVFRKELKAVFMVKNPAKLRGKIENSRGILKNSIEQTVVQIAQTFSPAISGEEIFPSFVTRLGQSLKLREDVYILSKIVDLLEESIADPVRRATMLEGLRNFLLYFESFTFRLLRHDDYEEFSRFFDEFHAGLNTYLRFPANVDDLRARIQNFRVFLTTTMTHINNRAELRDTPIDADRAELLLHQYIQ